ncbi:Protein LAS1 [Hypsizygus marmoreus]|uniref:Protein LAS1 n=1 Tax=Hypsizygus marmoreus TaxID=39966 RepID=A0A369K7Z5_HYPMA|nr:Protein LAS1 [Hypsizygus marmoreus]
MKLPRRVPWSSISELEQICSWIYTDENDLEAKVLAINRLSAWRATTYLPHALESALSILVTIVQDNLLQVPSSHLSLRQSYSTAIIRLVNGLVDPLQLGAYARSIASIASQLGLPPWLVELRHAATHEDLPSIDLLREAARESMVWLLHNYFLPTINPSSISETQAPLRPLTPILKQYKSLLKITTRDASLKTQYKPAVLAVMKDVDRWMAEAKVAANVADSGLEWEYSDSEINLEAGEMDGKERWALERLCDGLLEKGALVPLSKKKREISTDSFHPPEFSVQLWTPLLQHLQHLHGDFFTILCSRIVFMLLSRGSSVNNEGENQVDLSYDMCLARWAVWSIEALEADNLRSDIDLRKEVTLSLMQSLGHVATGIRHDRRGATFLLESLCAGSPQLEVALSMLQKISGSTTRPSSWSPEDIAIMNQRLNTLLSFDVDTSSRSQSPSQNPLSVSSDMMDSEPLPGWRLLQETNGWKPCPIGVHCKTIR